ncbi:hypothetical protein T10_9372 [Trichinella papuae]|uniref:Uncharacterized protein n=1 Tax=Trichinella papuae TaxID=268474 RepID=A0A0V1N6E3_9BILA|nr:hypothetical protein T10_9372 [Trichinella papuae]
MNRPFLTTTSLTLSASIGFKLGLLPPLMLVHALQLKQRDQQFHRLDRNSKDFLMLQKMTNDDSKKPLLFSVSLRIAGILCGRNFIQHVS